jgi:hypothetical protein
MGRFTFWLVGKPEVAPVMAALTLEPIIYGSLFRMIAFQRQRYRRSDEHLCHGWKSWKATGVSFGQ